MALRQRKNPLKNQSVLGRLSPWALTVKKLGRQAHVKGSKVQQMVEKKVKKNAAASKKWGKKSKSFYKELRAAYAVAPKTENAAASKKWGKKSKSFYKELQAAYAVA